MAKDSSRMLVGAALGFAKSTSTSSISAPGVIANRAPETLTLDIPADLDWLTGASRSMRRASCGTSQPRGRVASTSAGPTGCPDALRTRNAWSTTRLWERRSYLAVSIAEISGRSAAKMHHLDRLVAIDPL
jgi:hypothetical protein